MAQARIRVGIVGMQPGRSWSALAHMPALRALPSFEVTAVSTTRQTSAEAAAAAFGIPKAFADHRALADDPQVDLVVVAVKVPHHFEIVAAALDAGKMVYCEWPLGNGLVEAVALRDHAERAGVRTFVGLQARVAPVLAHVRDLLAEGFVGEVLSATLVGSGMNWGPVIGASSAYLVDKANGATLTSIPFGHALDALCDLLGDLREVSALTGLRSDRAQISDTGATIPRTAEDQLAVAGVLRSGAVVTAHYRAGVSRGTNLLWEINGTDGDLQITGPAGHVQIAPLSLRGARGGETQLSDLPTPDRYRTASAGLAGPPANMAEAYAAVARDIAEGSQSFPDFEAAVRHHRRLAAIEEAAQTGRRIALG